MYLAKIITNKVYSSALSEIQTENKCVINTLNPHSYIISKNDKIFKKALLSSDILLPDGIGIIYAARFLKLKSNLKKIAGVDIHKYLLTEANLKKQKVFYLGSTDKTLKLIEDSIKMEYPNVIVKSHAPSFTDNFSEIESREIVKLINDFNPHILFVGMTAPKQEKWVFNNKNLIKAQVIASIGAVFDFYAGTKNRPKQFWIRIGLEWFIRFLREPRRLWNRNFISTPLFLMDVIKEKLS